LIGLLQLAIMFVIAHRRQYPREQISLASGSRWSQIGGFLVVLTMPVAVVGSVVLGVATATESAAIGAVLALIIGLFINGVVSLRKLPTALRTSIMMSARIMIIIAFSQLFVWILVYERIPEQIASLITDLDLGPVAVLLLINVVVLLLGTFIDVSPAILLLTPTLLPAAQASGISSIQFGIVLISGLAVGACTPPVGNCLNVGATLSKLSIDRIFVGAAPFLLANLLTLLAVSLFPALVLWVPSWWMG
jgi:tripartite ATP-independent transporter DctM subunit